MFTGLTIHMIGIGGISMSGIAEILLSHNCKVTGYDQNVTDITKKLNSIGIMVSNEPNLQNVDNADIVIYTAAIKDDNEELKYAKEKSKELYERSVFLGLMMKDYKNVLCISGTHGKSTTTGMVSSIFIEAALDPTIQIGAMLPLINGNNRVGKKEYFIVEACEYVDSFLDFFPTGEIILNIDDDHLDYFKDINHIINSFQKYMDLLPEDGFLIVNNDDENSVLASADRKKTTYGINNTSNYMAKNITFDDFGYASYDLYINNELKENISLSVPGTHNIYNSLAAIALSHKYINDLDIFENALAKYTGVGRRFEFIGKYNGALLYDDYAHHPSEIKATVESVKTTKHNKSWAIFQSHTYSRTKDHLNEFAQVLTNFDNIIIAPIFAAREENIYGVSEDQLVNLIKEKNENVVFLDTYEKITKYIKDNVKKDDLVISIGAGDANKIVKSLVEN